MASESQGHVGMKRMCEGHELERDDLRIQGGSKKVDESMNEVFGFDEKSDVLTEWEEEEVVFNYR